MNQAIQLWIRARNRYPRIGKRFFIMGVATACLTGILAAAAVRFLSSTPAAPPKSPLLLPAVGIETSTDVVLDRPDYRPAKTEPQSPLTLRIESVESQENGEFKYRLLYTGLEPGVFNLTDFLLNPLGGRLKQPLAIVTVHSNIPTRAQFSIVHDQIRYQPKFFPYTILMVVAGLVWVGAGVRLFRPQKPVPQPVPPPQAEQENTETEPQRETLASLLRPLVEKAADKSITSREKAQIEQILFLYWGKHLELDHLDSAEQMRRIRDHTQAGALLRTVDQWLYQPASVIPVEEINTSLAKYESIPADELPPPRPTPPPPFKLEMNAANTVPIQ